MTEAEAALRDIAQRMKGRAAPATEAEIGGAPFDARLDHTLTCLAAGEPVVALEDLLDNLYEYSIKITTAEHDQLVSIADEWQVQTKALPLLRELIVN